MKELPVAQVIEKAKKIKSGIDTVLDHKTSRRDFLKIAGVGIGALALYNVFPKPVFELVTARPDFEGSKSFQTRLRYSMQQLENNTLVALGDSNMAYLNGDICLGDYISDQIKPAGNWVVNNNAQVGASTSQVLTDQLYPNLTGSVVTKDCDLFINAGGDDFLNMVDTMRRIQQLKDVQDHPVGLGTVDFINKVHEQIAFFGNNYKNLLDVSAELYGKNKNFKLGHMVVVSLPNFGRFASISMTMPDGKPFVFKFEDGLDRAFLEKVSILMNNEMFRQVDTFMQENPHIPVLGINTFDFGTSCFQGDEHYNEKGKKKIAEEFLKHAYVQMG